MKTINRDAVFCDETEDYRRPCEADSGQEVTCFFRTEKDGADAVFLMEYGRDGEISEREMMRADSDELFDYYEAVIPCGNGGQEYYFKVTSGNMTVYFNKRLSLFKKT